MPRRKGAVDAETRPAGMPSMFTLNGGTSLEGVSQNDV